ncbi:MAG: hypothetical protein HYV07_26825 [Deltaproteobacteria bacterium]|nr:hypothetical protein [Deltaproteobacteria bacterium]
MITALFAVILLSAPPTQPAPSPAPTNPEAEALAWEAVKHYRAERFSDAGAKFLEAYRLSHHPSQLRNAAKAFDKGNQLDRAVELWNEYLALPGLEPSDRAEAEASIAGARARMTPSPPESDPKPSLGLVAPKPPPADAPPTAALTPESAPTDLTPVAYGVGLAGVAVTIAGAILFALAESQLADIDAKIESRDARGLITQIGPSELESSVDSVNQKRVWSGALLGLGGAAISSAVVVWIFDEGGDAADSGDEWARPPSSDRPLGDQ